MEITLPTLLSFGVYLGVQRVATWLSDIYARLCDPRTAKEQCELLSIISRQKIGPIDCARKTDFLFFHKEWSSFRTVLEPHWSIYSVCKDYVYFVKTKHHFKEYTADEYPFVYMKQFKEAHLLARVTIGDFLNIELAPLRGRLVFFTNTPRSGTTLLAKILQTFGNTTVFGEPDVLTLFGSLYEHGALAEPGRLIKQIILYLGKELTGGNETIVLKTRSNGNIVAPLIMETMPEVRHLFCFRRSVPAAVDSCEKMMNANGEGKAIVRLQLISTKLSEAVVRFAGIEPTCSKLIPFKTVRQLGALVFAAPYARAIAYESGALGGRTTLVSYEQLLAHPDACERRLRALCGAHDDHSDGQRASECLLNDAQADTPLSRHRLNTVALCGGETQALQRMATALGLPRTFFERTFEGFPGL